MQHAITYDLARGLHIIAVIAWMSGLLMLPRFYACITAIQRGEPTETALLDSARRIRAIILFPAIVLSWAFGLFLFGAYFIPDREMPLPAIVGIVPPWFWVKLAIVVALSAYHGFLISQGRKLAAGERRYSERFWQMMSVAPFVAAIGAVLLATLEP
jgi:putative membrane protein